MGKKSRAKKEQTSSLAEDIKKHSTEERKPSISADKKVFPVFLQVLIVFLTGFLLYANTFGHQYAVDDTIVITKNNLTQQGVEGIPTLMKTDAFYGFFGEGYKLVSGGRYRPLSIVTFAIEIELFGTNQPEISHVINGIFYGLTGVAIFLALSLCFSPGLRIWHFSVAFIASILYVAHPLHTEAVANIKGRDEIMGMLFAMLTLFFSLLYMRNGRIVNLLLMIVMYILSLLSKENPITFAAIVPLSLYCFTQAKLPNYIKIVTPLAVISVIYFIVRQAITDVGLQDDSREILNNPFVFASKGEQLATVAFTFGDYLRLLFFPFTLTHDYYFNQVPIINWSDPKAIFSALINVIILSVGVIATLRKQVYGFSILYYFLTLSIVSNILFTVGIAMNERFLFMPSLGFSILTAWGLYQGTQFFPKISTSVFGGIFLIITLLYSLRTIDRNQYWYDDFTIFKEDVKNSPNSAKVHNALAGEYITRYDRLTDENEKKTYLAEADKSITRALKIYPKYLNAWLIKGNVIWKRDRNLEQAANCYKKVLEINPMYYEGHFNLGSIYLESKLWRKAADELKAATVSKPGKFEAWVNLGEAYFNLQMPDSSIASFKKSLSLNPSIHYAYYKIGTVYGRQKNDLVNCISWLKEAIQLNGNEPLYYEDLAVAYGLQKDFDNVITTAEKGLRIAPNYAAFYRILSVTYHQLGDIEKEQKYLAQWQQLLNTAP